MVYFHAGIRVERIKGNRCMCIQKHNINANKTYVCTVQQSSEFKSNFSHIQIKK